MRPDFAAFILSHGRADKVRTYDALRRHGYTGKIYIIIDDQDASGDEYRKRYGDQVVTFSKAEAAKTFDIGDNLSKMNSVVYARNVCHDIAKSLGLRYFIELDDDYNNFRFAFDANRCPKHITCTHLDDVIDAMLQFYKSIDATTIAMAQGGDFIGGPQGQHVISARRKVMNSFICSVERPFKFSGRMNDDVNTYVTLGRRGALFLTIMQFSLTQAMTQISSGGLTEMYLELGTYVKSFYTVMYEPSCTVISELGDHRSPHYRIHHDINWDRAVPKIIRESHQKPRGGMR